MTKREVQADFKVSNLSEKVIMARIEAIIKEADK
jgi:hypothetical protein